MKTAIAKIQALHDQETDANAKAELRKALDSLKRQETATEKEDRPDMRDENFRQVANSPPSGRELANEKAQKNREHGPLPETTKEPKEGEKTPPPIEA